MSVHVVDAYDVAIILGARLRQDGSPSAALARRVRRGVQLWHGGRARALLMTGGANSAPVAEARVMRDMAVAYGVMPDHVLTEERARNTIENALLVAPLVRQ
ncbi:MAG TPA: YdcF family protein, partial [Magnetospirillum sp.]|nr:YdcF family protein [Magnetospirillum sp.]